MLKEAPGPINFTVFLTMFGEKLKGEGISFFCKEPDVIFKKVAVVLILCELRAATVHLQALTRRRPS